MTRCRSRLWASAVGNHQTRQRYARQNWKMTLVRRHQHMLRQAIGSAPSSHRGSSIFSSCLVAEACGLIGDPASAVRSSSRLVRSSSSPTMLPGQRFRRSNTVRCLLRRVSSPRKLPRAPRRSPHSPRCLNPCLIRHDARRHRRQEKQGRRGAPFSAGSRTADGAKHVRQRIIGVYEQRARALPSSCRFIR